MHINAQRPVFVPISHQSEFEKLSKSALMDMVWDYAQQCAGGSVSNDLVMNEFRHRREIIMNYRQKAKENARS